MYKIKRKILAMKFLFKDLIYAQKACWFAICIVSILRVFIIPNYEIFENICSYPDGDKKFLVFMYVISILFFIFMEGISNRLFETCTKDMLFIVKDILLVISIIVLNYKLLYVDVTIFFLTSIITLFISNKMLDKIYDWTDQAL